MKSKSATARLLAEYEECVRLEHSVWGEAIAVPSALFVVAHHTGGQVLGAFHEGNMAGFTLALAAMRSGKAYLHSHMTAVLPEFRDRGVGRRLKLFQRQDALKRGIDLIEWTFDPLDLKNGHFNLVRLGAVARRYIPDCYGVTGEPAARRPADGSARRGVVAGLGPREGHPRGRRAADEWLRRNGCRFRRISPISGKAIALLPPVYRPRPASSFRPGSRKATSRRVSNRATPRRIICLSRPPRLPGCIFPK